MATIKFGEALGDFGFPSSFFQGTFSYGVLRDSQHHIIGTRLVNSGGGEIDLHIHNLKLNSDHVPVAGIVTKMSVLDSSHHLLVSLQNDITNSHNIASRPYNVHLLFNAYATGQFDGLLDWVLGGRDKISGSSHDDYIASGNGHDIIHGHEGDDWITGDGSNDTIYGDDGADTFWFGLGQGHDTVKDYEVGVDEIGLLSTEQLFHYDTAKGVYLQFVAADDPEHLLAANPADWMLVEGRHFSDLSFYNVQ